MIKAQTSLTLGFVRSRSRSRFLLLPQYNLSGPINKLWHMVRKMKLKHVIVYEISWKSLLLGRQRSILQEFDLHAYRCGLGSGFLTIDCLSKAFKYLTANNGCTFYVKVRLSSQSAAPFSWCTHGNAVVSKKVW